MRRHGEVPADGSRRERDAASIKDDKSLDDAITDGAGNAEKRGNVYRLFPNEGQGEPASSEGRAGEGLGRSQPPGGFEEVQPPFCAEPEPPSSERQPPDKQTQPNDPRANGTPNPQAALQQAVADHPITKALEAFYGPGGTPSPVQIIADSVAPSTARGDAWPTKPLGREPLPGNMPIRPLPDAPVTEPADTTHRQDQQDFWQLWLQHQDQLRKQCLHMMSGNMADAEDALSSAMLRASQKFQRYSDSILNEKAWLSKLVHNVCIDQFRQRKRTYYQAFEGEASEQVEDAMFTGPQPSPEEVALSKEQMTALQACLGQLSSNLRVPLMLRCVEGWSYPDIAEELDLRADTVRKRVQLARDFLRQRGIR